MARAVTQSVQGVQLSATVLTAEDSRRMLGIDVLSSGVQPVWIRIENSTSHHLVLLRSGTDANYFSPREVAWSAHSTFGGKANDIIDGHFDRVAFQNPIPAGATREGLLFTNPEPTTKLLNVDLLGNELLIPITLLLPIAGESEGRDVERMHEYAATDVTNYDDLEGLRHALDRLPCCASNADGAGGPAPVNVVLIGRFEDIGAAFVRSGYRRAEEPADALAKLFDRSPGIVARKTAHESASSIWVRVWRVPLTYRGTAVFAGQAGRPEGGRSVDSGSGRLHPAVDEVRNALIGDAMYSGGLAQLGFVTGAGTMATSTRYETDGLRVALFYATRPLSIADVDVLDWETPRAPRTPVITEPRP